MLNTKTYRWMRSRGIFTEDIHRQNHADMVVAWCLMLAGLVLLASCILGGTAHAHMTPQKRESLAELHRNCPDYRDIGNGCEYPDEKYADAIRHAEGVWNYGIKTQKCNSPKACREITLRTIHNNRIRFKKYGYKRYPRFVQFLGSRYCPTSGGNRTACEVELNGNWIKNVEYFLIKDKSHENY